MIRGGVWCSNTIDGNAQLEKIIYHYNRIGISSYEGRVQGYIKSKNGDSITFENGDHWKVIKADESGRGYRLNVSYIQREIPQEIINTVIIPATTAFPFQAFNYY
jgi:hypothetical protein